MAIFEVQYAFKCPVPECLEPTAHRITVTADSAVDARDLALAGLVCDRCGKNLPKGHFVQSKIKEIK